MGTRIDYDEALANPKATKARLAAGEKLTLVRDGVPFTHLSAPEDLDGFEPRRPNPAVTTAARSAVPLAERFRQGPKNRGRKALEELARPPADVARFFSARRAFARDLRQDDAARPE